jgi:hypothetical protein
MESGSPQSSPSAETGAYHAPETPSGTEVASERPKAPEKPASPEAPEANAQPSTGAPSLPALPQLPSLPAPQVSVSQTKHSDDNPASAADEDLVEKEWIDKAKKIVAQTRDDPYTQEKEVSKLQADYLKKRYGRELKLSSE